MNAMNQPNNLYFQSNILKVQDWTKFYQIVSINEGCVEKITTPPHARIWGVGGGGGVEIKIFMFLFVLKDLIHV